MAENKFFTKNIRYRPEEALELVYMSAYLQTQKIIKIQKYHSNC